MSPAEHTSTTCKNCQTTFEGKFCPNCSQKANTHRFGLYHFGHEFLHAVTHTDKGILFLIKELFTKPGKVVREYIEGKRKKYFNPISFLLIMMALQIYVTKKTDFYGVFLSSTEKFVKEISQNAPTSSDSLETLEKAKQQSPKILENSKLITFLFLPVLALLTWLFFWKSGFNYAENLILGIFVQGQLSLYFIIFCIVPFLIYPPLILVVFYAYFVGTWAYSLFAYRQFYQQRKWVTVFKGSLVLILYYTITQQIANVVLDYL